ncbi:MAG: tRNA (adenosine(37)-N6)-threonylcarbamoyltransferase complex dimerization subunit type 1 TsaB [Gammaproteobacteria bacterium]|nr:tRNA (adenosine(37)-N6)-threonylcarbamoyltransferase complex dimerization subunit type 1 TsaB [Gammaproteobacteria bacterium]
MKLLAIETAAEACSAALYIDGEIMQKYALAPRKHSELILPMMDQLLAEAELKLTQLDALAFGRGPGGFTGVRIATGVIQGVSFGADLPVVPVSTLAALAQRAHREQGHQRLLTAFDARMNEVYWAAYQVGKGGLVEARLDECVVVPENVPLPEGNGWQGVGSGWGSYRQQLGGRLGQKISLIDSELLAVAHDVAQLGAAGYEAGDLLDPLEVIPIYLRDKVAKVKGEKR